MAVKEMNKVNFQESVIMYDNEKSLEYLKEKVEAGNCLLKEGRTYQVKQSPVWDENYDGSMSIIYNELIIKDCYDNSKQYIEI